MKKDALTRTLAISGTTLVAFPIAAMLATSLFGSIAAGRFRMDYLIPAELGLFVIAGAVLLLWAAIRAHSRRGLIGWGIGVGAGLIVGTQLFAVATGLASGDTEPTGWLIAVMLAGIAGYVGAVIELIVAGSLLIRDLFARTRDTHAMTPTA